MDTNINIAWNAISPIFKNNFTFSEIKEIVGLGGLDKTELSHLSQKSSKGASKGQLIDKLDEIFNDFTDSEKTHFLNIVTEEILNRNNKLEEQLNSYLSRLGWKLYNRHIIPVKIFDISELQDLDENSHQDLIKASIRFRDGDLSGAIASVCGAVDSVANSIYKKYNLGDPNNVSFQERCTTAIKQIGILDTIDQLDDIGWESKDIKPLKKNLEGSLNQFAFVLQKLRAKMSDVHGTKPILSPLVFDSLKYAQILINMMTKNK